MFRMRVLLQLFILLVIIRDSVAKPRRKRRKAGPKEPEVKPQISSDGLEVKNFEQGRKVFLDKCVKEKTRFFVDGKGRPSVRAFDQLMEIIAEEIAMDAKLTKGDKMTTTTTTTTVRKFGGKRGKIRNELMAMVGGQIAESVNMMPHGEVTRQTLEKKELMRIAAQQMEIVAKRTKLPPNHKYNVREFCDIFWRIQNPSLLDQDHEVEMRNFDPWKEHEKVPDAYDDETEEDESSVEL